jgi:hypothetical protein
VTVLFKGVVVFKQYIRKRYKHWYKGLQNLQHAVILLEGQAKCNIGSDSCTFNSEKLHCDFKVNYQKICSLASKLVWVECSGASFSVVYACSAMYAKPKRKKQLQNFIA